MPIHATYSHKTTVHRNSINNIPDLIIEWCTTLHVLNDVFATHSSNLVVVIMSTKTYLHKVCIIWDNHHRWHARADVCVGCEHCEERVLVI